VSSSPHGQRYNGAVNIYRRATARDPPLPDEVLEKTVINCCYTVADLAVEFEDEYDPVRGTIRNRLEYLVEQGNIARRKHSNDTVPYRKCE
jgi:hypothetical protein